MDAVLSKSLNGKTVNIFIDQDPQSPRQWDNLGTILYRASSRYTLGDKGMSHEEIRRIATDPDNIVLPVYAYIHSGIVLNTTGYSCPWDSGQSGVIYVSKAKIRAEWGVKRISAKLRAKVLEVLRSEVQTYSDYLGGSVYGFEVTDPQGNLIDSCWGFYHEPEGLADDALNGAA